MEKAAFFPSLRVYLDARKQELDRVSPPRQETLRPLAGHVRLQIQNDSVIRLNFICTHNSRRSHLGQIWAKVAATFFGISGLETYSGGTEVTAMNPRLVAALTRAGLQIDAPSAASDNPRYRVFYSDDTSPSVCFSKRFDDPANPRKDYAAVVTCGSADQACPVVPGCTDRFVIRYDDPKVADDTPREQAVYDERTADVCREMLWVMKDATQHHR